MSRTLIEVASELFEREALSIKHGELPGASRCINEMEDACRKDPEGFIQLISAETSDRIETVAGFFEDLALLPDGAEWVRRIEEAVKGKETKDILEQIAFAKSCLA